MTAETITFYRAHLTGEPRARCERCGTVFAGWEDDELDHHAETCRSWDDQWTTCNRCGGDGGPPSHFDDETRRWHHYVCGSCSGSGLMRR
jgi:uncharacterized protein with PIN domain